MAENDAKSKFMGTSEGLHNIDLRSFSSEVTLKFDQQSKHQLVTRNKLSDSEADNIIEVLKQIKHEYTHSAQILHNTLQKLHLTREQLCIDIRKNLEEASQCHQFGSIGQHPIKETVSNARLAVETAKLAMQESTIKRRIRVVTRKDSDLKERMAVFQRELELVQDEYNALKRESDESVCAASICDSKAKKIECVLKELREEMILNGTPDEGKYKAVLERDEALRALRIERDHLQEEIQKYDELPPNFEEAAMVLLQAKQEHEELVRQISSKVNSAKLYK